MLHFLFKYKPVLPYAFQDLLWSGSKHRASLALPSVTPQGFRHPHRGGGGPGFNLIKIMLTSLVS